jgi:hypothetical protein
VVPTYCGGLTSDYRRPPTKDKFEELLAEYMKPDVEGGKKRKQQQAAAKKKKEKKGENED